MPFIYINNKANSSTPITTTPKDYFMSLMKNPLYTTINVNIKDIKFHITLDFTFLIVLKKLFLENDPEAAEIKEDEDLYSLEYIYIYKATENEEIGFNVLKGNKIQKVEVEEDYEPYDPYDPYEPYEPYDPYTDEENNNNSNNKNNDGKVGEKYVNKNNFYLIEENTNIITQLKKQTIISSYTFCIKYDNKNEEKGKIIGGGMPHEYELQDIFLKIILYIILLLYENDMKIGELILMILKIMEKFYLI